ncbi:hypothetical protein PPROV_000294400 [Pycnococcus provasolii]|uniref:Uncharacterized protein n=1 Tax=Pycnococcus provasolii TaxID=41880 RepID=A0A830HEG3_9CHLO|nr:hypothetical protein PPROV_000294400 [Pycnococcus provasolii]|mmetsp:Transcript_3135/g.8494  ORF Transcript_3135/g.8494 Transcript_3135/m.8494 type:complete len:432 (+) Transcript_3135:160-1455(+)
MVISTPMGGFRSSWVKNNANACLTTINAHEHDHHRRRTTTNLEDDETSRKNNKKKKRAPSKSKNHNASLSNASSETTTLRNRGRRHPSPFVLACEYADLMSTTTADQTTASNSQPRVVVRDAPWKGFAAGAMAAVCAGAVTHPIDLLKVRMQLAGIDAAAAPPTNASAGAAAPAAARTLARSQTLTSTFSQIVKNEGMLGLYQGLSGNVLRQTFLIGTRLGSYDAISSIFRDEDGRLAFHGKVACGLLAGALGALVGSPADMVMVRMQADGRLPPELRRNYKNAVDALYTIGKNEGIPALWRGVLPTMNRAMIVAAAQMAFYEQSKQLMIDTKLMNDGVLCHGAASLCAGGAAAICSNPFDVAKTRLQSMKPLADGTMPFRGTFHCMMVTVQSEGMLALYKGLVATWARQAPLNMVRFVMLEKFRNAFKAL